MDATPKRSKGFGPFHKLVMVVWALVAGWLVVSLLVAVIGTLYFDAGEVMPSALERPAPTAGPGPGSPPRPAP